MISSSTEGLCPFQEPPVAKLGKKTSRFTAVDGCGIQAEVQTSSGSFQDSAWPRANAKFNQTETKRFVKPRLEEDVNRCFFLFSFNQIITGLSRDLFIWGFMKAW